MFNRHECFQTSVNDIKVLTIFGKILSYLIENICSILARFGAVNLYKHVTGCQKEVIVYTGCRPARADESLAGLFVYTDPYLCFSLCPPAQLVANDFTLERLQRVSSHDCLHYCRP